MRQISMKEERPLIYNSTDLPVKQDQVIHGTVWASSLENLSSGFLTKRVSNQSPKL